MELQSPPNSNTYAGLLNRKVLITGGAGFIGSHIAEALLIRGIRVRIIDNLSTGNFDKNVKPLQIKYPTLEYMYGDITNLESCRAAMNGIDIICHQAALGSVPRSVADPLSTHKNNVDGFFNIILAAKEHGIKRFVYASSSSVYGNDPNLPKTESKVGRVLSPYAATKAVDEIYAGVFSKCYDMECIGLRYFNIFGPRQDPHGQYAAVIPKFIDMVQKNESPVINGDGTFSRDFTYVDNAVYANVLAMTTRNSDAFGQAFNIGAGGRTTVYELYTAINALVGKSTNSPVFGPPRAGDIPHSHADISFATMVLGYHPTTSFQQGIRKTVVYFASPTLLEE